MEENYYKAFLEQYLHNRHTDEEHKLFLKWFNSISEQEASQVMAYYISIGGNNIFADMHSDNTDLIRKIESRLDIVDQQENEQPKREFHLWRYVRPMAAAAILILIGAASYYAWNLKQKNTHVQPQLAGNVDIAPGGNNAMLTLSDGSTIDLNSALDGEIAKQSGTQISKVTDGQLVYAKQISKNDQKNRSENMNLVRTPKAGQYQINLSDGTKVWLNSLSSIRFPASFAEDSRRVEITGEAYFEVATRKINGKRIPFSVACNNQIIEVLGTHFNINSYKDEDAVKTTLLEGSVEVSTIAASNGKPNATVKLKPGQQSIVKLSGTASPIKVEKADTESAIAWKEGYFKFKDTDIQEVMKQISRWYDLDVVYIGELPKDQFTGYISKKVNISNVLNILEGGGGVKFSVNEKKVEVSSTE